MQKTRETEPEAGTPDPVLDEEAFRAILRRERALAERAALSFAVLAFPLTPERGPIERDALVDGIFRRIRSTDVVGMLSDEDLGVLLRYASVADALRLAAELCGSLGKDELPCTAYGFPPFELDFRSPLRAREEPAASHDLTPAPRVSTEPSTSSAGATRSSLAPS